MNAFCAKCGSEKIIPCLGVFDQGQHSDGRLKAHVADANPQAWLFRGTVFANLSATICGECGYTELRAEKPATVYEAYLAAKSSAERKANLP